jgi:hypothetical protein
MQKGRLLLGMLPVLQWRHRLHPMSRECAMVEMALGKHPPVIKNSN